MQAYAYAYACSVILVSMALLQLCRSTSIAESGPKLRRVCLRISTARSVATCRRHVRYLYVATYSGLPARCSRWPAAGAGVFYAGPYAWRHASTASHDHELSCSTLPPMPRGRERQQQGDVERNKCLAPHAASTSYTAATARDKLPSSASASLFAALRSPRLPLATIEGFEDDGRFTPHAGEIAMARL